MKAASLDAIYTRVLWVATAWALFNCGYVYLVLGGRRMYRLESAVVILLSLLLPRLLSVSSRVPQTDLPRPRARLIAIAGGIAWLALSLPFLRYPFSSDDYVFLDRYRTWQDLAYAPQFFRPSFAFVFWGGTQWGSGSPVVLHLVAMAIHFASALFVHALARRLFANAAAAAVAFVLSCSIRCSSK